MTADFETAITRTADCYLAGEYQPKPDWSLFGAGYGRASEDHIRDAESRWLSLSDGQRLAYGTNQRFAAEVRREIERRRPVTTYAPPYFDIGGDAR